MTHRAPLLMAAVAVIGATAPSHSHADTIPPNLSVAYPDSGHRAGTLFLSRLVACAYDKVAVEAVVWSTSAGQSGTSKVCPYPHSPSTC